MTIMDRRPGNGFSVWFRLWKEEGRCCKAFVGQAYSCLHMADGVGFEPTEDLHLRWFSRPVP